MDKNKLIIISGASGGIGEQILQKFKRNYKILAIYNKNRPKIISKNITYLKLDFKSKIKIKQSYFINKKIILIHLAAVKKDNLIVNTKYHDWVNLFKINVHSFQDILNQILPEMIKKKWGRIISFSSTGGINGDIGTSNYTASKYSLHGLNKVIAKEYGNFGITSNVVQLGNFKFGLYNKLTKNKQKSLLSKVPSKKTGNIKNIFNALSFIINSEYLNGSEIKIDGGI